MKPVELIACALGLGAGLVAARLAVFSSTRLGDGGFWRQLASVSRLLLSPDDEKPFFREYLRLWPLLIAFVARQLAVALIATTPIALAFACLALLAGGFREFRAATGCEWQFLVAVCTSAVLGILAAKFKS